MLPFDPQREAYVSLATFRKSGREVRTPVWIAPRGDKLYVYTNAKSGKVKRIRAGSRARLAACDMRGKLKSDWVDVRAARMLDDPDERERGLAAIVDKYPLQMRVALLVSRLSGRHADRAAIELTV